MERRDGSHGTPPGDGGDTMEDCRRKWIRVGSVGFVSGLWVMLRHGSLSLSVFRGTEKERLWFEVGTKCGARERETPGDTGISAALNSEWN